MLQPSEDSFATVLPNELVQSLGAEGNVMLTLMQLNEEAASATESCFRSLWSC